jgi:hypothetical protein
MLRAGESTMPEQVENQESTKLVEDTPSEVAAEKRIERVAEKEAEKSTKTVQHYDEKHVRSFQNSRQTWPFTSNRRRMPLSVPR